eukprot:scaffold66950_cov60-Phaeocystis_antarctica.AAC.1
MELSLGHCDVVGVSRVDDVDDGVHAATVSLPHRAKARLAAQVPQLNRHLALGHLAHVEAHRRYHVLRKAARLRTIATRERWPASGGGAAGCVRVVWARTATTLTSVVFPEFCRPTSVSSISCLKKRLGGERGAV